MPFREPPTAPSAAAPSRDGPVRLEAGPHHVRLELGARWRLTVSDAGALWVRRGRRRADRKRELPLGRSRLWVARAHPTRDLALWYEPVPGVVERLGGVRPVDLSDPDPLASWRALDRLATDLTGSLATWSGGAGDAVELGRGEHRVLLVALADRLVVYARPIFRERPRRALEVCSDGTLVVPGRKGDRRARFHSRLAVNTLGDRIAFADEQDRMVASIWLPWIAPEDRKELARRFGELVDPSPPEPVTAPRSEVLRPWASGLGRHRAIATFLPAPLPMSAARFRR